MRLPRFRSFKDFAQVGEAFRDVIAALRLVPDFEIRRIETQANVSESAPLPIRLQRVTNPMFVMVSAYQKLNPRAATPCESPSWQRTTRGIEVYDLTGLTPGIEYVLRVLVVGGDF